MKMSFCYSTNLYVSSLLLQFYNFFSISSQDVIDCTRTRIWGPGINPVDIITPARYFFLQTYDSNSTQLKKSPGRNVFNIRIQCFDKKSSQIRTDFLDRQDGSFIVRYKLYSLCSQLQISVNCLNNEIQMYEFKETIYPAECICKTEENLRKWLQKYDYELSSTFQEHETNLKYFSKIDMDKVLQVAEKTILKSNNHCICNYIIKDNLIYRKCYGPYTGFKMFVDSVMLLLTKQVRLPDVEFLVNLGDWPVIEDKMDYGNEKILLPVFSWCGSNNSYDIIFPTYDLTESSIENLGRVTLDILSVQGNSGPPWGAKVPKLFWRGRDANRERLKLIDIARRHPSLINASLTNFFFFKELENKYGPAESRVSFFEFFKFKYQLNVDGTVAAYRFPYLLAGKSLIFKQESPYYEHFYHYIKEWVHYVPVKRDLSDLTEKIEWALANDNKAQKIAENGQKFVNDFLLPHHVFSYHVHLLNAFSRKLEKSQIKIRPGMEKVEFGTKMECGCSKNILPHGDEF